MAHLQRIEQIEEFRIALTASHEGMIPKWNNTTGRFDWVPIIAGINLGVNHDNAYYGDLGKIAYDHSQTTHFPVVIPGGDENVLVSNGTTWTSGSVPGRHLPITLATDHGLSLSAQTLALGTPSSITSTSTNSVTTTTHTHAITASLGFIGNGSAANQIPLTGTTPFTPIWTTVTNLVSLNNLSFASTAFVKMTSDNTFGLDTNVYIIKSGDTGLGNMAFNNNATIDNVGGETDVLNIGTAYADTINIGWSGSTVNIQGTLVYQNVDNLEVKDKLIRLNKGGAITSGSSSGFEIEENAVVTGWLTTSGARTGFELRAPATTYSAIFLLSELGAERTYTFPNTSGTVALTTDLSNGYIPYTGATGAVNLGAYDLTVNGLTIGHGLGNVSSNNIIGTDALRTNTTGNNNIAIGSSALYFNTTGSFNTVMGVSASYMNNIGSYNVAIGNSALYSNTSGINNTCVGYNAGRTIRNGDSRTTGNYGVYLGSNSRSNTTGTTNEIVVGSTTIGNGSNTATWGNTSITNHYFSGDIGATGTRVTKIWAVDMTITNAINASITGTAAKATNLVGGNNTTLLGSIPYQSNTDTTTLLAPNATTTKKFLSQTGTGANGAAPIWTTVAVSDLTYLLNDEWLKTYDYAGNVANLIKLSKDNITEFANPVGIDALYHVLNSGFNDIVNIPVDINSPDNTEHGIGITVGGTRILKVSALSDGAGLVDTTTMLFSGTHLGFYNVIPVVRPTALTTQLTSLTHVAAGTPDYALQDLVQNTGFGFVTKDEGNTVLSVILNLQIRVAELETKLRALGLLT